MISINGSYNDWIVLLSFMIALFTSYSALNLTYKLSKTTGRAQWRWLVVSGLVMGFGIWSMHFVGMLAFHMEVQVNYHLQTTIISLLASICASMFAFYITNRSTSSKYTLPLAAVIMGAGIVTMHYTGMASMQSAFLQIKYDPLLFILSAVIAVMASYAALFFFIRFRHRHKSAWTKWLVAFLMGTAICGMHYTGMEASSFWCIDPVLAASLPQSSTDIFLIFAVSIVMLALVVVTSFALFWERKILKQMAYSDPLTGLPNRHAMNQYFTDIQPKHSFSVLFLDLDQFKLINDTLGHDVGDLLVKEVGSRISGFMNASSHIFRLGGDEFLMVTNEKQHHNAERLAEQILEEIRKPYVLIGNELYVTGSIGISYSPEHGTTLTDLLKSADTAMYYAKGLGKNQYCSYNEELNHKLVRRMEIEKGLRTSFVLDQLKIHYQPKWNAETNKPIGFEALLRWTHPTLGNIAPAEFIPIAEETGLIVPITRWVLKQACMDCTQWNAKGDSNLSVSVNLSLKVIESKNLWDMVDKSLQQSGLSPELLELEIIESVVHNDVEEVLQQLKPIQEIGVRISMDNFGSGYSFLGSIGQIPFHTLKIDRLYMQDFESPTKQAVVNSIVTLASELKLQLIAEGVENESQLQFLKRAGCSIMQGYYFKQPMPREELDAWLDGLSA
ncbi:bifunctional diguanylate cyclase/phosphodiesterase [Paenibacillus sp. GXUN7292]|uniref:bifunctional diguanylate cyclase/phosphodiesterase n=1 Tax=Paenibacillus sp. GXUN7292 TaxID=3422499 RepID=UPI003D7D5D1D